MQQISAAGDAPHTGQGAVKCTTTNEWENIVNMQMKGDNQGPTDINWLCWTFSKILWANMLWSTFQTWVLEAVGYIQLSDIQFKKCVWKHCLFPYFQINLTYIPFVSSQCVFCRVAGLWSFPGRPRLFVAAVQPSWWPWLSFSKKYPPATSGCKRLTHSEYPEKKHFSRAKMRVLMDLEVIFQTDSGKKKVAFQQWEAPLVCFQAPYSSFHQQLHVWHDKTGFSTMIKSYFYFDKKQSSCRWSYYFCEERPVHRYFHWLPGGTVNNCSSLDILTILFLWTDSYLCENVSIILSRCLLAFASFISWISSLPCVVQRTSQIFYYQNKLKNTTIPCSITKQW